MTTANKLTIARVVLIPVFLVLAYMGHMRWALAVFVIASLTDMLDGYIARHYNQITDFGKFMDPLADKVLVMAAMCFFVETGRMSGWALAIVLLREFAVSGMRLVAVEQGRVIAAAPSGKIKTAATMVCLCLMLFFGPPEPWDSAPDFIAQISTAVILITTVWSGVEYFWKNRDVFRHVD
ncbi:MAG: CDP-diacylglycerol--glycerol-3-phosphate 3-phosphatidyltransferase [Oscillospiraceae bacterium]|nr:CDP-diacylglycerol--glycerol-3-phosphate 3-phosphatidyltransferase [Oscillospiraceae bacterium]